MSTPSEILKLIIDEESTQIPKSFTSDSYYAVLHLIRRLDVVSLFDVSESVFTEKLIPETKEFFNLGWSKALKPFYADLKFHDLRSFYENHSKDVEWADSAILFAGKLGFCQLILDYEKSKFVEIINPKKNEFGFRYLYHHVGIEYFERVSLDFYRIEIVERIIKERKEKKSINEEKIREQLKSMIINPLGKYIAYTDIPVEVDEYYGQQGHFHMFRMQCYDNFDEKDRFGHIEYKKYVDVIEAIMGVAQMHKEACVELINSNPNVDIHNILSYLWYKDKTIEAYADRFKLTFSETEQIFSCVTLTKENYEYYLDYPGVPPPMYFQVSNNQIVRSIAGCLNNPFRLLNSELKRKYKRDYDIAVTKREERFRNELFLFFSDNRIVKIPRGINISFDGNKTDIDAVAYDTKTKTLGLFQLKWQDPFALSMKERRSRISNLFPKANEWIEKVRTWTSGTDVKTILNALQIVNYAPDAKEIGDVYVFVLSRNHIHFTEVQTDESVAWGSWFQIIESKAKIKTMFDDPIREMFVKLKVFSPNQRLKREEMPKRQKLNTEFSHYRIYYFE